MKEQRTPIGKFIHSSWTALNMRAGKYRNNSNKNRCYLRISIEFSQPEYKNWCLIKKDHILSLKNPSIDRIDSNKNYSLENIQIIELSENCRKKKFGCRYLNGPLDNTPRGVRKSGRKWTARITFKCKEVHLGTFNSKEEALYIFKQEYYKLYGKYPFE